MLEESTKTRAERTTHCSLSKMPSIRPPQTERLLWPVVYATLGRLLIWLPGRLLIFLGFSGFLPWPTCHRRRVKTFACFSGQLRTTPVPVPSS